MAEELIEAVVEGAGSTLVRVDDVTTTAVDLVDQLPGSDLVEGADTFIALVEHRREELAERVAAHTALELLARADSAPPAEPYVVNDLAGLRSLIDRLTEAEGLIEASRDDVRSRATAATEIAVHPTAIRDAAADVLDARADVLERQAEVDRLAAEPSEPSEPSEPAAPDTGDEIDDEFDIAAPPVKARDQASDRWSLAGSDEIRRAAIVAVVALVIGILAVVVIGSPLPLVLPAVAVCWLVVVVVRRRDSAYDHEIASRNLENVARLTDRAYGGAGLVDAASMTRSMTGSAGGQDPARLDAERALTQATDRLAYAESAWRSLVGPDVDVDDVESVVQARDAQYGVSDEIVDEMPSFRTAAAHERRLRAQWKLAWWALDRPVPEPDDAIAALDELEAQGVEQVTVETRPAGGLTVEERDRLDDLVRGRSEHELRAVSERVFPVVIVADAEGVIDEDRLSTETAQLPDDVRFVVVAPAG